MYAIESSNCSCKSTLDTFQNECQNNWFDTNIENTTKLCTQIYLNTFRNSPKENEKCLHYCPLECENVKYLINPYIEVFPVNSGYINNETISEPSIKNFKTYDQAKKNYLCLLVFYSDLKYSFISQIAKTELFSCISSIGGILSLFLGISFISFFEIFEIIFEAIHVLIRNTVSSSTFSNSY